MANANSNGLHTSPLYFTWSS